MYNNLHKFKCTIGRGLTYVYAHEITMIKTVKMFVTPHVSSLPLLSLHPIPTHPRPLAITDLLSVTID